MKTVSFLVISILISSLLLRCNDNSLVTPKQEESVQISKTSKNLGIIKYRLDSKYISADSRIVNLKYTIASNTSKEDVQMSFIDSKVLKLNFINDSNKNNELVLNFEEMSLSFFDGTKNNVLRLRTEYNSEEEYLKAREIFDKNSLILKTLLASSDDMLGNINYRNNYGKGLGKTTIIKKDNIIGVQDCPTGGNYHTETSFSGSRSVAAANSMNDLQFSCNNSSCIGCSSIIGTDCFCLLGDYGCWCTSKGCSCSD